LALSVIYGGRNTVDLQIGQLGQDTKYVLKRNGSEVRTWDSRAGDPTGQMIYHADLGCDTSTGAQACGYSLELYGWRVQEPDTDPAWHLNGTEEVTALAGSENGILHNGTEWCAKLGRSAVSWSGTQTYYIEGVTLADGELWIMPGVFLHFWGAQGSTAITFGPGTRLAAADATFSSPSPTSNVNLDFGEFADPTATPTFITGCTFDKVNLSLNGHHRAVFHDNTFTDATIDAYDSNKLEFSQANTFSATEVKPVSFLRCHELTFINNTLTNTRVGVQDSNSLLFQGNTSQIAVDYWDLLSYTGDTAVIKNNNAPTDQIYVGGAAATVEGNTLRRLVFQDASQSTVKSNTVGRIDANGGSGYQILDNSGKRIEILEIGGATVSGNQLSCWNDVANGDNGIYLQGTVAGKPGNVIESNTVEWCNYGIHLYGADGANIIRQNNLVKCGKIGIYLEDSSDNQILNNAVNQTGFSAYGSIYGIWIGNIANAYNSSNPPDPATSGSKRNVVAYNSVWKTYGDGIHFPVWPYGNDGNGVHENTVEASTGWAVYVGGNVTSSCAGQTCAARNVGNFIYNNVFKNNAKNASDIPANETHWNHAKEAIAQNIVGGSWLGGNWWDDYMGTDGDGDGLGDTPYEIRDTTGTVLAQDTMPLLTTSLTRILVHGAGDAVPARIASQGEASGEQKLIDARWLGGVITGDARQVLTAGAAGDVTIKATGGFGMNVAWTGCSETTGNGTPEAVCILRGPLAGGDRNVTATVTNVPYRFLRKWGGYGTGTGQFKYPKGLAVDSAGNLYVADKSNHRIQKFDNSGAFLAQWGSYGTGNGQFNEPIAVAVDPSGNVYVADGAERIQKFDNQGNFLLGWGGNGSADSQFREIQALALDATGQKLYVLDNGTSYLVKVFSAADGSFLRKWWLSNNSVNKGTGIALGDSATIDVMSGLNPEGYAFVAQDNSYGINKYRPDGSYRRAQFGNAVGEYTAPGQLTYTFHLAIDRYNHLYVVDSWKKATDSKYNIQKFDSEGNFIGRFGSYGDGDGQFQDGFGIAVDANGNVFVSEGYPADRIQVFAATPVPPVPGDIDGDGLANLTDVIIALQLLAGVTPTVDIRPNYPTSGADVNGDNKAGLAECLYLMHFVAGLRAAP
jgi:parallel beta-helix repeat protein